MYYLSIFKQFLIKRFRLSLFLLLIFALPLTLVFLNQNIDQSFNVASKNSINSSYQRIIQEELSLKTKSRNRRAINSEITLWNDLNTNGDLQKIKDYGITAILGVSIPNLKTAVINVAYVLQPQNIKDDLIALKVKSSAEIIAEIDKIIENKAKALWDTLKESYSLTYIQANDIDTILDVNITDLEALDDKTKTYDALGTDIQNELKLLVTKGENPQELIDIEIIWEIIKPRIKDIADYAISGIFNWPTFSLFKADVSKHYTKQEKTGPLALIKIQLKNFINKTSLQINAEIDRLIDVQATALWGTLQKSDSFTYIQNNGVINILESNVDITNLYGLDDKTKTYDRLDGNIQDELKELVRTNSAQFAIDAAVLELKTKALWTSFIGSDSLSYLKANSINRILGVAIPKLKALVTKAANYEDETDDIKDELKLLAVKGNDPQQLIDDEILALKEIAIFKIITSRLQNIKDYNITEILGITVSSLKKTDAVEPYDEQDVLIQEDITSLNTKTPKQVNDAITKIIEDKAIALWNDIKTDYLKKLHDYNINSIFPSPSLSTFYLRVASARSTYSQSLNIKKELIALSVKTSQQVKTEIDRLIAVKAAALWEAIKVEYVAKLKDYNINSIFTPPFALSTSALKTAAKDSTYNQNDDIKNELIILSSRTSRTIKTEIDRLIEVKAIALWEAIKTEYIAKIDNYAITNLLGISIPNLKTAKTTQPYIQQDNSVKNDLTALSVKTHKEVKDEIDKIITDKAIALWEAIKTDYVKKLNNYNINSIFTPALSTSALKIANVGLVYNQNDNIKNELIALSAKTHKEVKDEIDKIIEDKAKALWGTLKDSNSLTYIQENNIVNILATDIVELEKLSSNNKDYDDLDSDIQGELKELLKTPDTQKAIDDAVLKLKAKAIFTIIKSRLQEIKDHNITEILGITVSNLNTTDAIKSYDDQNKDVKNDLTALINQTPTAIDNAITKIIEDKAIALWNDIKTNYVKKLYDHNIDSIFTSPSFSTSNLKTATKDSTYNESNDIKNELIALSVKTFEQVKGEIDRLIEVKAAALWEAIKVEYVAKLNDYNIDSIFTSPSFSTSNLKTAKTTKPYIEQENDVKNALTALSVNTPKEVKDEIDKIINDKAKALWGTLKDSNSLTYIQENNIVNILTTDITVLQALDDNNEDYDRLGPNIQGELKELIKTPNTQQAIDDAVLELKTKAIFEIIKLRLQDIKDYDITEILDITVSNLKTVAEANSYIRQLDPIKNDLIALTAKTPSEVDDAIDKIIEDKAKALWGTLKDSPSLTYIQDNKIENIIDVNIPYLKALTAKNLNYTALVNLEPNIQIELEALVKKPDTQNKIDAAVLELKTKSLWTNFIESDSFSYMKDNSIDTILGVPIPALKALVTKAATYEVEEDNIKNELKLLAAKGNNPQGLIDEEILALKKTAILNTIQSSLQEIKDHNIDEILGITVSNLETTEADKNYDDQTKNIQDDITALIDQTPTAIDNAITKIIEDKAIALWEAIKTDYVKKLHDHNIDSIFTSPSFSTSNLKTADKDLTYDQTPHIKDELIALSIKSSEDIKTEIDRLIAVKAVALWEAIKTDYVKKLNDYNIENIFTSPSFSTSNLKTADKDLTYDQTPNIEKDIDALSVKSSAEITTEIDKIIEDKAKALWTTLKDSPSLTYIQDNKIENIIDVNIATLKTLDDNAKNYDDLDPNIKDELTELVKTPQTQDAIDNAILKQFWSDLKKEDRLKKIQIYQKKSLLNLNIPLLEKVNRITEFDNLSANVKKELKELLTKNNLLKEVDDEIINWEQKTFQDSDDLIKNFQKDNSILDTLKKLKKNSFDQKKGVSVSMQNLLKIPDWSKIKSAKDLSPEAIQELKQITKLFSNKDKERVKEIKKLIDTQNPSSDTEIISNEVIIAIYSVVGFVVLLIIIFFIVKFLRRKSATQN